MSTIFDNIITGVWPSRFVWADDVCITFATIGPTSPGHAPVVPRTAYDAWTDAPSDVAAHLMTVVCTIGLVQKAAFGVPCAGLAITGFEVPHTHLHIIPLRDETDILLSKAAPANDEELDNAITALHEAPPSAGYGRHAPSLTGLVALAWGLRSPPVCPSTGVPSTPGRLGQTDWIASGPCQ